MKKIIRKCGIFLVAVLILSLLSVTSALAGSDSVRLQETGGLFDTLGEAIAAANTAGLSSFTLEVIDDVDEPTSPVIGTGMNVTIIGAGGEHTVTLTNAILVQGGSLTLGDGTGVNPLTIDGGNVSAVSVTDGTATVRDGIILESNSTVAGALRFHGTNAGGSIEGGTIYGNSAAISVTGGARISEISGGFFRGENNAMYLSDPGSGVDLISDGTFYQISTTVLLHGHGIFMDNNSTIGVISDGMFWANRESGLALVRGAHVGEISGGTFVADRDGGGGEVNWTAAVRVEGENALTSIGTIAGGWFWGENFGVLVIVYHINSAPAEIGSITGGLFQGARALQVDTARPGAHCRIETITGGKFLGRTHALLNAGFIGEIGGDAEFRTEDVLNSSSAIWNLGGTINEISGGIINSSRGNGIANTANGTINLISGGIFEGSNAISNSAFPPGRINTITGGVFWGRTFSAIALQTHPVRLEPDLTTERIGFARFRAGGTGTGNIFNNEALVIYPGEYFMSAVDDTLPVPGIAGVEFRFLRLQDPEFVTVTFVAAGGGSLDGDTSVEVPFAGALEEEQIPAARANSGHRFIGWFLNDEAITIEEILELTLIEDITIEARFEPVTPPGPGPWSPPPTNQGQGPGPGTEQGLPERQAYLIGIPEGLIRPGGNITRAEVATIFFRLITDDAREQYWMQENPFPDVSLNHWFNNAVSTMTNAGIFIGRPDGTFAPNATITRAEMAATIVRFMGVADEAAAEAQFNDIAGHWAEDYINQAASNGWIQGDAGLGGAFRPSAPITRAEVAAMINRILGRLPETAEDLHPEMITWPDNDNTEQWYYLYKQSASNSYTYEIKDNGIHERWVTIIPTRDWVVLERPDSNPGDIR